LEAKFLILSITFLLLVQCQSKREERAVEAVKTNSSTISNADIIRNPITANHPKDTVNVAKMEFDATRYHFGEVKEGTIIKHIFSFTNTGKAPLIISDAKSTCGCTIPEWPKNPILAGESGAITVRFNTDQKIDHQVKPVFITANTHPSKNEVQLIGTVLKK